MPCGYSKATEEEIGEVVTKLCKLYPQISKENHMMIADTAYDNYFSEEGMFQWYEETAPKLTPKVLEAIREDLHPFFYRESHLVDDGYTPLSDRNDL